MESWNARASAVSSSAAAAPAVPTAPATPASSAVQSSTPCVRLGRLKEISLTLVL